MEKHRVRLGVERLEDRSLPSGGFGWPGEWRSIDGTGNNRAHPEWGGAGGPLLRIVPAAYADGMG
ncbi:MAG TPA: peroxidase family protein, partial [Gemmataceae bacterium]